MESVRVVGLIRCGSAQLVLFEEIKNRETVTALVTRKMISIADHFQTERR